MTETPLKQLKKFHTISLTDKIYKSGLSTTANRLTSRKSNSVLANPQSILNSTLPLPNTQLNINLSLPKIKQIRKQKKQGTFLQSWLDQALGSPDPFATQKLHSQDRVEGNILKTLKKFQLDKRYLQSQNIPGDKIQKLYQNLYIYSHGVNRIFQQLITVSKQVQNSDLINNFWRAYAKLLQGCTSYQTVFQKVEKDHLHNIQRLKFNIESRTEAFGQEKKELENKIKKLEKTIQEKQVLYQQLSTQFDVVQNTLSLTDQAFNDQVNLRLKFQEKINAVYTCYEELKAKYAKIVQQMAVKNIDIIDRQNKQNQLKNKLLVQKTKVDQLFFLLQAQRQKVQQRESQLSIKCQQIQDIKSILLSKQTQQSIASDRVQQHLIKTKSLQTRIIQLQNIIAGQRISLKQHVQLLTKHGLSLQQSKEHNNQLYKNYQQSMESITQFQAKIEEITVQKNALEKLSARQGEKIGEMGRLLGEIGAERDGLKNQLEILGKNYKNLINTVEKNNVVLQDMKAVKDKYERINFYLDGQVKELEGSVNKAMGQLGVKTQQLEGMRLLVDNRSKMLTQMEKSLQQERQVNKIKISALNTALTKKEALSIQYQKKTDQMSKQLQNSKSLIKIWQDKHILLQSIKTKLQVQLSSKTKLLADLQQIMTKQNNNFRQLSTKFESQHKQKQTISSKLETTSFVLKTKNQQERLEIKTLTNLLSEYKERIVHKAQYIHPMVHEEMREIARRLEGKMEKMKGEIDASKEQLSRKEGDIGKLEKQKQQLGKRVSQLIKNNNTLTQQKQKQQQKQSQKIKILEQSIKNLTSSNDKSMASNKNLSQQLEQKGNTQKILKQKIKSYEQQLSNMRIKMEEITIENSRKKTSRVQTRDAKRKGVQEGVQTQAVSIADQNKIQPQLQHKQTQTQKFPQSQPEPQLPSQVQKNEQKQQIQILSSNYNQIDKSKQLKNREQGLNHLPVPSSNSNSNSNSNGNAKKQQIPQKKVETKDFKKALKFTYMRR